MLVNWLLKNQLGLLRDQHHRGELFWEALPVLTYSRQCGPEQATLNLVAKSGNMPEPPVWCWFQQKLQDWRGCGRHRVKELKSVKRTGGAISKSTASFTVEISQYWSCQVWCGASLSLQDRAFVLQMELSKNFGAQKTLNESQTSDTKLQTLFDFGLTSNITMPWFFPLRIIKYTICF